MDSEDLNRVITADGHSFTCGPRTAITLYPERLPPHSIRLLKILPSKYYDAPIECELHQHEVSGAPGYQALSYVWGDPNDVAAVTCNGLVVYITKNLRNALNRTRDSTHPEIIWADALCLNQIDVEEKNAHVPLMGRVYSQATNTVIYLGESSHEEAALTEAGLRTIFDFVVDFEMHAGINEDNTKLLLRLVEEIPGLQPLGLFPDVIQKFFDAAWFERIWCVQEIVLARNSGHHSYAIYGHTRISYYVIMKVALCLLAAMSTNPGFVQKLLISSKVICNTELSTIPFEERNLLLVLDVFRDHVATDPRDKVYGLLGLLCDGAGFDPTMILVDYSKSVAEVYYDTAVKILQATQDLELLDHTEHPEDYYPDGVYPSWVPRWDCSVRNKASPIKIRRAFKARFSRRLMRPDSTFDPCGASKYQLLVHGSMYSPSTWVSTTMWPTTQDLGAEGSDRPNFKDTFSEFWKSSQPIRSNCYDHQEILLLTARTFTNGYLAPGEPFGSAAVEKRQQYTADFLDYVHHVVGRCSPKCPGAPSNHAYVIDADGKTFFGSRERYTLLLKHGCAGQKLCQLNSGACGIGPPCMREGDVVVALLGGSWPYVLRPKGERFLFLGSIYIDGLMDGRYFEQQHRNGAPVQQFALF